MKPNTDFEFVRRILEKCERGEVLDAEERKYGEIFESLKSKSQKSVKMDADFHESLKRELMETYSELYPESQKGYFVFPKIPKLFFWFAVSLCLMVAVGFGVFNILGTGMEKSSERAMMFSPGNVGSLSNKDTEDWAPAPSQILEKTEISQGVSDSAKGSDAMFPDKNPSPNFIWKSADFSNGAKMSNSLKGAARSDDGLPAMILWWIILLLVITSIGLMIFLKRRKK